jgi:hypothetical protein
LLLVARRHQPLDDPGSDASSAWRIRQWRPRDHPFTRLAFDQLDDFRPITTVGTLPTPGPAVADAEADAHRNVTWRRIRGSIGHGAVSSGRRL